MAGAPGAEPRHLILRRACLFLLSLALHGLVLTPMALNLTGAMSRRQIERHQAPIYLDIQPWPRLETDLRARTEEATRPAPSASDRRPGADPEGDPPAVTIGSMFEVEPVQPVTPVDRGRWQVKPEGAGRPPYAVPADVPFGCRLTPGRPASAEPLPCEQVLAETAASTPPIAGTSDPARDARFAALGDQALADYERRRAPLKPNSRANPCPQSPNPGDPCAFSLKGRIWSSRDGWLPDLRRRQ